MRRLVVFALILILFPLKVSAAELDPTDLDPFSDISTESTTEITTEESVPEELIDFAVFDYVEDVPSIPDNNDLYILLTRIYNLFVSFVWIYLGTWLFDLLFKTFNVFFVKNGGK